MLSCCKNTPELSRPRHFFLPECRFKSFSSRSQCASMLMEVPLDMAIFQGWASTVLKEPEHHFSADEVLPELIWLSTKKIITTTCRRLALYLVGSTQHSSPMTIRRRKSSSSASKGQKPKKRIIGFFLFLFFFTPVFKGRSPLIWSADIAYPKLQTCFCAHASRKR